MKVRPGIEAASLTDVGCHRENNEDNYLYWEPESDAEFARVGRLAVVADGMGGAEGGQFASRIAVETVQAVYAGSNDGDPQARLIDGLRNANFAVQKKALETPGLHGMGTTLTACSLIGDRLTFAHVGDSRLFLIRDGAAQQLTRDHSLVARLVEAGTIRPEDAESHPQKHVLTAAIGVMEDVQPDYPSEPVLLQKGDTLVLCTDGLWGQVSGAEIAQVIKGKGLDTAAKALVSLAKERGGPDNITLQILKLT